MPDAADRPADKVRSSQSDHIGRDTPTASDRRQEATRRVLVIAYYFPPMGLSGVQRTAKFVKYLPEFGWRPTVLTCEPRGYFAFDESLWSEIEAAGIDVVRAGGWDPTRLFGKGKVVPLPEERRRRWFSAVSQFLFVPDNKIGWYPVAVRAGRELLRDSTFDAIFSTAPPYSAHLVGRHLSRRSGLPLVLDFRDDWLGNPRHSYPTTLHRAASMQLEKMALRSCRRAVAINEQIRRNLLDRNADVLAPANVVVIPQGFDPKDFRRSQAASARSDRFTLLYAGVFYDAQKPDHFLQALADLVTRRADLRERVEASFAGLLPASAMQLARDLGIESLVRYAGYLPHDELVQHLLAADVLWMTIGRQEGAETISTSKLFEYFGTRKPILGLVPRGAAREALTEYGAAEIVEPDSVPEISAAIERLYDAWENGELPAPAETMVERFDRRGLTDRLQQLLESVVK